MFSKITQPTIKNFPPNYSAYDEKSVICGDSGKSLLLKSYGFSNTHLLWILDGQQCYRMYWSRQCYTISIQQSIVSNCIY